MDETRVVIRHFTGPQCRLRVAEAGQGGVPVLLVHGLASRLEIWNAQLDHLALSRQVVAFDLRGNGESARPENGDYSLTATVDDILAIADAYRMDRFVLVGHSYAGAVVGILAGTHPQRVAALVLADAAGDLRMIPQSELEKLRAELHENFVGSTDKWFRAILVHASDEVRDRVLATMHATPEDVYLETLHGSMQFDPEKAYARYRGPKLSIAAADFDQPKALHYTVPGFKLKLMRDVSHWLMMDKPDEFNAHLDELLRSVDSTAP